MVSTRQMATSNGCGSNSSSSSSTSSAGSTTSNAATVTATTTTTNTNGSGSILNAANETTRVSVVTRQATNSLNYILTAPPSVGGVGGGGSGGGFSTTAGSSALAVATAAASLPSTTRQHNGTHLTQAVKAISSGSATANEDSNSIAITTLTPTTTTTDTRTISGSYVTTQRHFFDLPLEILTEILSYVEYKKIGHLRIVSRKMNDVCMHILNSTFSKLITQTYNRFHAIKANMPRRESARRNHPLACECDIIETCYMRLSLLQMTFGKHIERGHCCFFPGAILDEVYNILNHIKTTPRLERPYRVTDELFDLSTMAMEYFRDRIESTLPDIYFNKDFLNLPPTTKRPTLVISSDLSDSSSNLPSPPQSNMVLRKGIRKIKQGMKIYNNQLSVLRTELRTCKRKSSEQAKQIGEQQKLLAEQQKQMVEYANRLDENDKKNEEISRKFSTCLQELNKCKTELQYWRSKSPAIPTCTSCGQKVAPVLPPEDYQALINQGVKPEDIFNLNDDTDAESDISTSDNNLSALSFEFVFPDEETTAKLLAVNTAAKNLKRQHAATTTTTTAMTTTSNMNTSNSSNSNSNNSNNNGSSTSASHTSNAMQSNSYSLGALRGQQQNNDMSVVNRSFVNYTRGNMAFSPFSASSSGNVTASCTASGHTTQQVKDLNNVAEKANATVIADNPATKTTTAISGNSDRDSNSDCSNSNGYSTKLFYGNTHKGVIVSPSMLQAKKLETPSCSGAGGHSNAAAAVAAATCMENGSSSNAGGSGITTRNSGGCHGSGDGNNQSGGIGGGCGGNGVEDVTTLQAITTHETKKARRVQKATRCLNASGKRSKS